MQTRNLPLLISGRWRAQGSESGKGGNDKTKQRASKQIKLKKLDVLRGRLPGRHNDFWKFQPPTLQPLADRVNHAQSWTAQFRAFSSHKQHSAHLNKEYFVVVFYYKIPKTYRIQHVTIIFKSNFVSKPRVLPHFVFIATKLQKRNKTQHAAIIT